MVRLRFAALLMAGVALSACSNSSEPNVMRVRAGENEMSGDLDVQIRRAQMLRLQGNYTEATRALGQMMLAVPDDPRVVGEYGKLLAQKGETQDAIAFLRRATELNPGDWSLYSAMGVAYDQNNDQNAARVAYDRALALKPNDPSVLNNYAMNRVLAKDLPQAARLIQQAKLAGGNDPKIQRNADLIASLMPEEQAARAMTMAPIAEAPRPAPLAPVARNESRPLPPVANTAPFVSLPAQARPVAQQPLASVPVNEQSRQPTGAPRALQPQASNPPQPVIASKAPTRSGRVVMQEVPIDPLAGPVANTTPIKLKPPKSMVAKAEAPKPVVKAEPKIQVAKTEPVKLSEPVKPEAKPTKTEAVKSDIAKVETPKPVKTDVAKNDAPKTDAKKPDVKAASSKPDAKPETKPSKPVKTQFAETKPEKNGGIPRLRMAADSD